MHKQWITSGIPKHIIMPDPLTSVLAANAGASLAKTALVDLPKAIIDAVDKIKETKWARGKLSDDLKAIQGDAEAIKLKADGVQLCISPHRQRALQNLESTLEEVSTWIENLYEEALRMKGMYLVSMHAMSSSTILEQALNSPVQPSVSAVCTSVPVIWTKVMYNDDRITEERISCSVQNRPAHCAGSSALSWQSAAALSGRLPAHPSGGGTCKIRRQKCPQH